jgi:hypothetical protein
MAFAGPWSAEGLPGAAASGAGPTAGVASAGDSDRFAGASCAAPGASGIHGAIDASDRSPLFLANTLAGCGLRAGGAAIRLPAGTASVFARLPPAPAFAAATGVSEGAGTACAGAMPGLASWPVHASGGDCGGSVPARGAGMSGATRTASPVFAAARAEGWPAGGTGSVARPESPPAGAATRPGAACGSSPGHAVARLPAAGPAANAEGASSGCLDVAAAAVPVANALRSMERANPASRLPAKARANAAGSGRSARVP